MIAVQRENLVIFSALLNTRMPKVNVNLAKASGHNAIFYSVQSSKTTMLNALLQRGANPNVQLLSDESYGNTPLHFACAMEKLKHVELLLEFGANPLAFNMYGQAPLHLLPKDALKSTRMYIVKLFKEAVDKQQTQIGGPAAAGSRRDL